MNHGFSTLEMMLAIAIALLTMSAVFGVSYGFQSGVLGSQTNAEAVTIAQGLIEQQQAKASQSYPTVGTTNGTVTSGGLSYNTTVNVSATADPLTELITALVSWTGDHGQSLQTKLSTLVTNPSSAGGCNPALSGDWTNPVASSYQLGADILNDTSSGFPITSIQASNGKIYATVNNSHGNNSGTFFILRPAGMGVPTVLGQLDNNTSSGDGLNSVAIDDTNHYAYVANGFNNANFATCTDPGGTNPSCAQLQVIDISDPTLPGTPIKYDYKVPGVTGSGGKSIGSSVFYNNGIVYIGLASTGGHGPEFNIIDVGGGGTPGASPSSPKPLGSYPVGNTVTAITVSGNYAYLTTDDQSNDVLVLNVSNPALSPLPVVGHFDAPGIGFGNTEFLVGSKLYAGVSFAGATFPELYALDTTQPIPVGGMPILGSKNINSGGSNESANGVLVRSNLAFLVTSSYFEIWKIDQSTNPYTVSQYATPLPLPPGHGQVQGTANGCQGNYLYVGSQDSNDKGWLSIITSS